VYITKTIDIMDENTSIHHLAKKSRKPITKTIVYEYLFLSPNTTAKCANKKYMSSIGGIITPS